MELIIGTSPSDYDLAINNWKISVKQIFDWFELNKMNPLPDANEAVTKMSG